LRATRPRLLRALRRNLHPQHVRGSLHDPVLHRKRIGRRQRHAARVQFSPRPGIHQRIRHAHLLAHALQIAFQHQVRAEIRARLIGGRDVPLPQVPRRHHLKCPLVRQLRQLRRHRVRQAGRERRIFPAPADRLEFEHRQLLLPRHAGDSDPCHHSLANRGNRRAHSGDHHNSPRRDQDDPPKFPFLRPRHAHSRIWQGK